MTQFSPYTTPRRETLNPLRNLYLAYLGEVLCAAVIRFYLDYRAIKGKFHNYCASRTLPSISFLSLIHI